MRDEEPGFGSFFRLRQTQDSEQLAVRSEQCRYALRAIFLNEASFAEHSQSLCVTAFLRKR